MGSRLLLFNQGYVTSKSVLDVLRLASPPSPLFVGAYLQHVRSNSEYVAVAPTSIYTAWSRGRSLQLRTSSAASMYLVPLYYSVEDGNSFFRWWVVLVVFPSNNKYMWLNAASQQSTQCLNVLQSIPSFLREVAREWGWNQHCRDRAWYPIFPDHLPSIELCRSMQVPNVMHMVWSIESIISLGSSIQSLVQSETFEWRGHRDVLGVERVFVYRTLHCLVEAQKGKSLEPDVGFISLCVSDDQVDLTPLWCQVSFGSQKRIADVYNMLQCDLNLIRSLTRCEVVDDIVHRFGPSVRFQCERFASRLSMLAKLSIEVGEVNHTYVYGDVNRSNVVSILLSWSIQGISVVECSVGGKSYRTQCPPSRDTPPIPTTPVSARGVPTPSTVVNSSRRAFDGCNGPSLSTPSRPRQDSPPLINSMNTHNADDIEKIGRALSRILRHRNRKPNYKEVRLRSDGCALMTDVLTALSTLGFSNVTHETIRRVVDSNDKKRFSFVEVDGVAHIRAVQGHSRSEVVESEFMQPITDPSSFPTVVHGTSLRGWSAIKTHGLSRMDRHHIHFASGEPGDVNVISGVRFKSKVLIFLDMRLAMEAGCKFFLSENGVIGTSGVAPYDVIPTKCFSRVLKITANSREELPFIKAGVQVPTTGRGVRGSMHSGASSNTNMPSPHPRSGSSRSRSSGSGRVFTSDEINSYLGGERSRARSGAQVSATKSSIGKKNKKSKAAWKDRRMHRKRTQGK